MATFGHLVNIMTENKTTSIIESHVLIFGDAIAQFNTMDRVQIAGLILPRELWIHRDKLVVEYYTYSSFTHMRIYLQLTADLSTVQYFDNDIIIEFSNKLFGEFAAGDALCARLMIDDANLMLNGNKYTILTKSTYIYNCNERGDKREYILTRQFVHHYGMHGKHIKISCNSNLWGLFLHTPRKIQKIEMSMFGITQTHNHLMLHVIGKFVVDERFGSQHEQAARQSLGQFMPADLIDIIIRLSYWERHTYWLPFHAGHTWDSGTIPKKIRHFDLTLNIDCDGCSKTRITELYNNEYMRKVGIWKYSNQCQIETIS